MIRGACHHQNTLDGTRRRPRHSTPETTATARLAPGTNWRYLSDRALGQSGKGAQDRDEEPPVPNALALSLAPTLFIPSFQSPVPMSGNPWAPSRKPCSEGAHAMFVDRARLFAHSRQIEIFFLVVAQDR